MLHENQVQEMLKSASVFHDSNAHAVTVTWHFTLYAGQSCIWSLVSNRTQTGRLQSSSQPWLAGSVSVWYGEGPYMYSALLGGGSAVSELQTSTIH